MKSLLKAALTIFGSFFIILLVTYITLGFETYCFWNPTIDTVFSDKFSEKAFDQVSTGMSREKVLQLLGNPISETHSISSNQYTWHYTQDGKCKIGDWAWVGRLIVFDPNWAVTSKHKTIYYD